MRLLPLILLLCIYSLSCGCKERPDEYQGKSLRYWESQAASTNPNNRRNAAEALGKIGPKGLPVLLTKLLQDPDHRVRAIASLALLNMGHKALPQLIGFLKSPDADVRAGASKALLQLGPSETKAAIPALREALHDSDARVRHDADLILRLHNVKPASTATSSRQTL